MNTQEALQTLINGVRIATKRGAFELGPETDALSAAISTFTTPQQEVAKDAAVPANAPAPKTKRREVKK